MIPLAVTWVWPDTLITIGVILVAAALAHLIVVNLINLVTRRMQALAERPRTSLARKAADALSTASRSDSGRGLARFTAVAHLLRSVWTIFLVVMVVLMVMSTLGLPLSPILASAGIGGVMLAFGAQSLIKDYLSGIALIVEDQYGPGDQIVVGDVRGTVVEITLRITKIRDTDNLIWYVRNGEILKVGNITQGETADSAP